jgi:hypothetical protein
VQYKTRKKSARGANTFEGEPCAACGSCRRYINTNDCYHCQKARNKKYFSDPVIRAAYNEKQAQQYHDEDRIYKVLIDGAKARARKKQFEFTLTLEDIQRKMAAQNGLCYYTGIPMEKVSGSKKHFNILRVSLDRIDSAVGYTNENVILCTLWANIAKHHCTGDFFEMLCSCVVTQAEIRRLASSQATDLAIKNLP